MNVVDLIIILLVFGALVRGAGIGSVRQVFSTAGFFIGLFVGTWLAPHVVHLTHSEATRSWLTLLFTLGFGLILLTVGEYIGIEIKRKILKHWANKLDRVLGAAVGGITALVVMWFSASVLISVAPQGLRSTLRDSSIIGFLDRTLPPTPNVIADISHLIDPNGFPQVFTGIEPSPVNQNTPIPSLGALNAAVQKDRPSVVKIEGIGCGGVVEGSGFVATQGLVITNAHVVAGVYHPFVIDAAGQHPATAIWFDPNLDLAVLKASNLVGTPLPLNTSTASDGSVAAVLGYPEGGAFNPQPAVVLDEFNAIGRNIYGQGYTNRSVYEVKATVVPGNSGGPLVTNDGSVIGVVFAASTTYNQVGFALSTQRVAAELTQAEASAQPVATGACAQ